MAPKQSQKKSTPTKTKAGASKFSSTKTQAGTSKSPRAEWKTGEQLEWMLTKWTGFLQHQNEKKLDCFWPTIYSGWYKEWPIDPTPESIMEHGSKENAILAFRFENNERIRMWFHNHARPSAKVGKSDLKLSKSISRKLAPTQAYCSYAWDKGLRELAITAWDEQKKSHLSTDDDDPTADAIGSPGSGSHIPINFKMKIAKEQFKLLTPKQKQEIDGRREEEQKKMQRLIPDIADAEERDEKLHTHHRNQPAMAGALLHVLKNLEDQAGGIAYLIVGSVNPSTGVASVQRFCQGKTKEGANFQDFCGDEWEELMEGRFSQWGAAIFGEPESQRRSTYMFSHLSSEGQGATGIDSVMDEGSVCVQGTGAMPIPQNFGTLADASPQALVSIPMAGQPQFVNPQDVFPPYQPVPHVSYHPISAPPIGFEPYPIIASSSQSVMLDQVAVSPTPQGSPHLVTPLLTHSVAITENQTAIPTIAREHASLVTPVLESTTPILNKNAAPGVLREPVIPAAPLLDSSLINQSTVSSVVYPHHSLGPPPPVLEPSEMVASIQPPVAQGYAPDRQAADSTSTPQQCPPNPVAIVAHDGPAVPVTAKGTYRLRDKAATTIATRGRRDSIDGAPEIMLSLGPSGYDVSDHPQQQEPHDMSAESATLTFTPSATPSPATPPVSSLAIIPSSQQTVEECLVIPPESNMVIPAPPSSSPLEIVPSSQQTIEECLVIPPESETVIPAMSAPDHPVAALLPRPAEDPSITTMVPRTPPILRGFHLALRETPIYDIDRSVFPSWFHERGRLDFVLSVEGGEVWKRLITAWLKQERRVGFGLNDKFGASLSLKDKPSILADYFKWHHNPSKGDTVALPDFGNEVAAWWFGIQPEWRYKNELKSNDRKDYSYILAGGKKGVYLLILCLAWWDNAHGRGLEEERAKHREGARTNMGSTPPNFDDLLDHDCKWFNIVNDLLFVLELAQAWPVPEGPLVAAGAPSRKKRAAERGDGSLTRKKAKAS